MDSGMSTSVQYVSSVGIKVDEVLTPPSVSDPNAWPILATADDKPHTGPNANTLSGSRSRIRMQLESDMTDQSQKATEYKTEADDSVSRGASFLSILVCWVMQANSDISVIDTMGVILIKRLV